LTVALPKLNPPPVKASKSIIQVPFFVMDLVKSVNKVPKSISDLGKSDADLVKEMSKNAICSPKRSKTGGFWLKTRLMREIHAFFGGASWRICRKSKLKNPKLHRSGIIRK